MSKKSLLLAGIAIVLGALALVAVACDGDDDDDAEEPTATGAAAGATATEGAPAAGSHSQILADVTAAGMLECGVNDSVPGFGFVDPDGNFSGFDIDFCKAIAAAVLGDADAVNYTPRSSGKSLKYIGTWFIRTG